MTIMMELMKECNGSHQSVVRKGGEWKLTRNGLLGVLGHIDKDPSVS